jgi:hypothetical protein
LAQLGAAATNGRAPRKRGGRAKAEHPDDKMTR